MAICLAALSASFAAEQPGMDMVKAVSSQYVGKYKTAGSTNTDPQCEITEATINIVGFGKYKMTSLIHISPRSGKDSYSAYLDDPHETWITLQKMNEDTLEIRFLEKVTQKTVRTETYARIN